MNPLMTPHSEAILSRNHLHGLGPVEGFLGVFRCSDLEPGLYRIAPGVLSLEANWPGLEPIFQNRYGHPGQFPAALLFFTRPSAGATTPIGTLAELDLKPLLGPPPTSLWRSLLPEHEYYQGWSIEARSPSEGLGLAEYLQVGGSYLRPPLISAPALLRLGQLAQKVSFPIQMAMFECRMTADEPQVDISLEILPVAGSLAQSLSQVPAAWSRLRELAEVLDEHTRANGPATIGLEFDAHRILEDPLLPAIFLGLATPDSFPLVEGWTRVLEAELWESCASSVEAFYARLPEGAKVVYFGLFPGRGLNALRLNVNYPDWDSKLAHLSRLFPSALNHYLPALNLTTQGKYQIATFDLFPSGVGPRVGFEAEGEHLNQCPEFNCCPRKLASLKAWPGSWLEAEDPQPWPRGLSSQGQRKAGMVRSIGHVKWTIQPDLGLSLKAYPTLSHLHFDLREVLFDAREKLAKGPSAGN